MRLAFPCYRWHPHSGRARNLLFLLEELQRRGHYCRVYSADWRGDIPPGADLRKVTARGFFEQRRQQAFISGVQEDLGKDPVDGVVGFHKYPALDACFITDSPESGGWAREWEQALFAPGAKTHLLFTVPELRDTYRQRYNTPESRLHLLPPGVTADRQATEDAPRRRKGQRAALELESQEFTLLFIGSDFARRGLDGVIGTLARILEEQPSVKTRLLVVGDGAARRYRRRAQKRGVADRVDFLGPRDDIPDLMQAADLLVYPARDAGPGTVLLEALAAGLPCVASEACGYAPHVAAARAGILLPSPFSQEELDRAVMRYLDGIYRADCRESALLYARLTDLYSMHTRAADLLEQFFAGKPGRSPENH